MVKLLALIGVVLLLPSCSMINQKLGLADDNIGEEVVEDVVKGRTGVDVDLTPQTQEKK